MHTGTPAELADKEQRTRALAYQLADLLNRINQIAPGSLTAANGRITGLAFTLRPVNGHWTVDPT